MVPSTEHNSSPSDKNKYLVTIKSENKFEIKIEPGSKIGFSYEVKSASFNARGSFPPKDESTISLTDSRLSYNRNSNGTLNLNVSPDVTSLTAIIHDKNGKITKLDLIKGGSAVQTEKQETPEPQTPGNTPKSETLPKSENKLVPDSPPPPTFHETKSASQDKKDTAQSISPAPDITPPQQSIFRTIPRAPLKDNQVIILPAPPKISRSELGTLPPATNNTVQKPQASPISQNPADPGLEIKSSPDPIKIPGDIAVKVQLRGLTPEQIKGIKKDENGRYTYCNDKDCIDLGFSKTDSSKATSETGSKREPDKEAVATKATAEKKELSLKAIPPDSKLKYEIQYADSKGRGSLDLNDYKSFPVTMSGIGVFSKNQDGTIAFEADKRFNGKIQLDEKQEVFGTPYSKQPDQTTATTASQGLKEENPLSKHMMTSHQAKKYISEHPDENVVVVVTNPGRCPPCKKYEEILPGIVEGLGDKAKVIIVDERNNSPDAMPSFNVKSIPATLIYNARRIVSAPARILTGPQKLDSLGM